MKKVFQSIIVVLSSVLFFSTSCSSDNQGALTEAEENSNHQTGEQSSESPEVHSGAHEPGENPSGTPEQPPEPGDGSEESPSVGEVIEDACKDVEGLNKPECYKRVIPEHVLPALEAIPGDCGGWSYPEHPEINMPELPEYGYEAVIDTERYNISRVYDVSKADETSEGFKKAIKDYKEMGFTRIVIPPGHYPVNASGIKIPSNVALIMGNQVKVQMTPRNRWDSQILNINGDNVYVEGGILIGEKYEHISTGDTDEECNGITIWNSSNVFINGVRILHPHGDGIMVINNAWKNPGNEDFKIYNTIIANCEIDDPFRSGISVCGTDSIRVSNNHIHHARGTVHFGINFESDNNRTGIVDHNTFNDNYGGDINLAYHVRDMFIEHNVFDIGNLDEYTDATLNLWSTASYVLYHNYFKKRAPSGGCSGQLFCTSGTLDTHESKCYIVDNDFPAQRVAMGEYNYLCIKNNVSHEGVLAVSIVPHLRFLNNRVEKFSENPVQGKVDYAFYYNTKTGEGVKGLASGNVTCKLDDNENEVCTEVTKLNEMKEDEDFTGMNLQTF